MKYRPCARDWPSRYISDAAAWTKLAYKSGIGQAYKDFVDNLRAGVTMEELIEEWEYEDRRITDPVGTGARGEAARREHLAKKNEKMKQRLRDIRSDPEAYEEYRVRWNAYMREYRRKRKNGQVRQGSQS